jgi:hypothetical protein
MANFLQDSSGNSSSMRLIMLIIGLVVAVGIAYLTYVNRAFPVVPESIIILVLGVTAGKVTQSIVGETPGKGSEPTPPSEA